MVVSTVHPLFSVGDSSKDSVQDIADLQNRGTDELVIALVGPVGSGVTKTAGIIGDMLVKDFGYSANFIKVSDIIKENCNLINLNLPANMSGHQRISKLQDAGSKIRKSFSDSFLAEKCVEAIAIDRINSSGYDKPQSGSLVALPRRRVHIIDSLKNPAEVQVLRDVYGEPFWLFGVFAPEDIRKQRLQSSGVDSSDLQKILITDEEEGVHHGQKVRDTMEMSDFFVRNDGENDQKLKSVISRYLSLIFNLTVHTPTQSESAMYTASSASTSSACLSRQVGAAIYSAQGELLGKGANDVPRPGGGLYNFEDNDKDHRCYKWGGHICHNDDRKNKLYGDIFENLRDNNILKKGASYNDVVDALKKTDVKNLIEYSRANHAEMEAILSVARAHKAGIVGSTMYCTTFPCHACARLIVGSGIKEVIYIEPYPKSLALKLHKDAISERREEQATHVIFTQYEGVAPKNIIRLFKMHDKRKAGGKLITHDPKKSSPICRSPLDGFSVREQIVVKRIEQLKESKLPSPR